eukprot:GEMP01057850.1.p1 GENE.GEMP01057850.1~~GEMP01057850.1.p1  ORF type:complete len:155 (+),score=32.35 GEMP01057850.1:96-560(+)
MSGVILTSVDGGWCCSGAHIADIGDHTLYFRNGPAAQLISTANGGLDMYLCGTLHRAELLPNGAMLWSNGDVWTRMDATTQKSVPTPQQCAPMSYRPEYYDKEFSNVAHKVVLDLPPTKTVIHHFPKFHEYEHRYEQTMPKKVQRTPQSNQKSE